MSAVTLAPVETLLISQVCVIGVILLDCHANVERAKDVALECPSDANLEAFDTAVGVQIGVEKALCDILKAAHGRWHYTDKRTYCAPVNGREIAVVSNCGVVRVTERTQP